MFVEPEKLSIQSNCRKRKYGNNKIYKKPDKKLNRQTKIKKVSYCCGNDNGSYSKVIFRKSSNIGKGFFSATAVNLQKSYFVRAPNR